MSVVRQVESDDDNGDDEFYDPAEYAPTTTTTTTTTTSATTSSAAHITHLNSSFQHHQIHVQHVQPISVRTTRSQSNASISNSDHQSNEPTSPSASQHIHNINLQQTNKSALPSSISNLNASITHQSINHSHHQRLPQSPSAHSMSSQREMSRELSNSSIRIKRSASPRDVTLGQSSHHIDTDQSLNSLPMRNLDTEEICSMNEAQLFFPEIGAALTMDQLEAYERSKLAISNQTTSVALIAVNEQPIVTNEPIKLSESEVNERRRTLGILGKIAKTFSMSSSSSSSKSTAGGKVKTKSKHCQLEILDDLIHAQTLHAANGPIWCVAVSHDGQFVATGGQDSIVRVWAIVGSLAARQLDERIRSGDTSETHSIHDHVHGRLIVHPTPYRVCSGHRADITCLSWSHSDDFLLSSSIDKTVCLWHVSSSRCIRVFPHTDLITCIAFHPREHRYFISGSFDNRIRLWNIIECRVVEWAQTAHFVTALTFSPSGHMVVAGLHHGQCVFYATAGLKYHTQVDCRNRSGKHARGKKVTGVEYSRDGSLLLVTTNDSRIRCYRMTDFGLHCKMKGVENESLQIKATFYEEQGQLHAICGSDKEVCAVWKIPPAELQLTSNSARESENSTSRSQSQSYNSVSTLSPPIASSGGHAIKLDAYEYFKAIDDSPVTCALFLPTSSIAFSSANESQSAMPIRHIVLASGLHGEIKMYENRMRQPDYMINQSKSKR